MPDLVCIADANAPEYSTRSPNDLNNSSTKILSKSGCVFFNPVSFGIIILLCEFVTRNYLLF